MGQNLPLSYSSKCQNFPMTSPFSPENVQYSDVFSKRFFMLDVRKDPHTNEMKCYIEQNESNCIPNQDPKYYLCFRNKRQSSNMQSEDGKAFLTPYSYTKQRGQTLFLNTNKTKGSKYL